MFYAKNFKTPTLIRSGELDYRVPYGNGLELYGVLQAIEVCRERHPHPQSSTPQLHETARYSDRARHQLP